MFDGCSSLPRSSYGSGGLSRVPIKPGHIFVWNTWYVAALSTEVGEDLLERRILGNPLLLYRTENGVPVALYGLCPHRRLPLRMGKRIGDAVQCGYHGITFGADGVCLRIPSQARPADRMRLQAYPVVERGQWIWIWPGDPALADPDLIPNHDEMGLREGWEATPFERYPVAARFQLLIENLLDLSHISFLHGSYIEDEAWFATPVRMATRGAASIASRHTPDSARSKFHEWMFPHAPERVDQDLRTVFLSPALIYSGPVVREVAGSASNGRYLGTMNAVHAITPETTRSSHYFSTTTRDFRIGDQEMTAELHGMDVAVRMQDVVALGAIEAELDDENRLPPEVSVRADNPALHIRKIVGDMIASEQRDSTAKARRAAGEPD